MSSPDGNSFNFQFDPPVSDSIASLRVRDLDSLANNDTVTTWGTSTATQNPIYRNDASFPYVDLNGGVIDLGTYPIVSADGFTYTGLVLSTNVSTLYPPIFTYMSARDDGLRLMRSGSGADLYFYSDGPKRVWPGPATVTDVNTWQVFSVRASNNGDNTVTMDIFIDNVNMGTNTVPVSDFCDNTSGNIDVGKSSLYPTDPAVPIYISDTFFYDRALTDAELAEMYTYLNTLGDPHTPSVPGGEETTTSVPGVFSVDLSWPPKAEDLTAEYRVEYSGSDGSTGAVGALTSASVRVKSLTPNTEYVFQVYASNEAYGSSVTTSTLEKTRENFSSAQFQDSSGDIDLSELENEELRGMGAFMNDMFESGSSVKVRVSGRRMKTKFVKLGESVAIPETTSLQVLLPFDTEAGAGQSVTLSTDAEDMVLSYDESSDQVTLRDSTISSGDSLVVMSKKLTVFSV